MGLKQSALKKLQNEIVATNNGRKSRKEIFGDDADRLEKIHEENESESNAKPRILSQKQLAEKITANLPVPAPAIDNLTADGKNALALRGNTRAMKHGIFSKKAPAMVCDNCYLVRAVQDEDYNVNPKDVKCPHYKPKAVCIYFAETLDNELRGIEDVQTLMEETIHLDKQRILMARAIEVYESGGALSQSLDMGMERMMNNLEKLKNLYIDVANMKKPTNDGKPGVLSQLFAMMGAKAVDADVVQEDAKPK